MCSSVEVVRQFSTHGRAVRPFVGISMLEVSNGGLRQLRERVPRLPLASMHALVITRVLDGSPAAECGLQSEDVLLSLDGAQGLPLQAAIDRLTDAVGVGVDVTVLRRDAGGVYQPLTMRLTPVEAHQ
ncbi:hypothetical protein FOA52_015851 [Chlamydomonas sp. UWO 241]|nr:hypothetical protein FOA52_015851 [Chlamydomonas sp. UWO 241]